MIDPDQILYAALMANDGKLNDAEKTLLRKGADALREHQQKEGLNKREIASVQALVSYAAHVNEVDISVIKSILFDRFPAKDIPSLSPTKFMAALEFIVDLDIQIN